MRLIPCVNDAACSCCRDRDFLANMLGALGNFLSEVVVALFNVFTSTGENLAGYEEGDKL